MAVKKMAYQYETSPRKLEPDYKVKKKTKKAKKTSNRKKDKKAIAQAETKRKVKICSYILITFLIFLAISYRNTLISQRFSEIQELKGDAKEIQKENEQLEMSIQNSMNLPNVEDAAKLLGMQKLNNNQKVYIQLKKKDYIEPSDEEIVIEESSWIDNIIKKIKSLF